MPYAFASFSQHNAMVFVILQAALFVYRTESHIMHIHMWGMDSSV